MAITLVSGQVTSLGATASGTQQSSGAFASNPTVGNYVIVWAWCDSKAGAWTAANLTCSDNIGGNTYTQAGFVANAANDCAAIFFARVSATGASFAPKATASGTTEICICAAEFSTGGATLSADGAQAGATGSSGAPAPGTKSFTAGDLVCACMADDGAGPTVTTPSGFTSAGKQTNGTFEIGEGCYAIAPASPTNPAWNSMGTNTWGAVQVAFIATASGTAFLAPPPLLVPQAVRRASFY